MALLFSKIPNKTVALSYIMMNLSDDYQVQLATFEQVMTPAPDFFGGPGAQKGL